MIRTMSHNGTDNDHADCDASPTLLGRGHRGATGQHGESEKGEGFHTPTRAVGMRRQPAADTIKE